MPTPPQRVWVVGAGGMLGQAVCQQLALCRVAHVTSGREVPITVAAALRQFYAAASRTAPVHAIINCAAMTAVDDCEQQLGSTLAVNGHGVGHLAHLAASHQVPMVHVSTDYVFGSAAAGRPLSEQDATSPANAYGRSKLLGEALMWQALQAVPGAWGAVVRTSWLFGEHGGNFVFTMLRLMAARRRLEVVDDQWGRPTYTGDLARAMLGLLGLVGSGGHGPAAPPGTYHFANTGATSWHGFAAAIWTMARRRGLPLALQELTAVPSSQVPRPATRPTWSVMSTRKISQVLGSQPRSWWPALGECLAATPTPLTSVL